MGAKAGFPNLKRAALPVPSSQGCTVVLLFVFNGRCPYNLHDRLKNYTSTYCRPLGVFYIIHRRVRLLYVKYLGSWRREEIYLFISFFVFFSLRTLRLVLVIDFFRWLSYKVFSIYVIFILVYFYIYIPLFYFCICYNI